VREDLALDCLISDLWSRCGWPWQKRDNRAGHLSLTPICKRTVCDCKRKMNMSGKEEPDLQAEIGPFIDEKTVSPSTPSLRTGVHETFTIAPMSAVRTV
jgi:hypothetical protein